MSQQWIAKQLQFMEVDFDEADKNGDGKLSFGEVMSILRASGYNGAYSDGIQMFKLLDVDGDRNVTKEEFRKVMASLPKMTLREFALRKMFKALDTDRNGYLTRDEVDFALKNKKELLGNLGGDLSNAMDCDADGKVNYDEFLHHLTTENEVHELTALFKTFDADGSGFVTLQELNEGVSKHVELSLSKDKMLAVYTKMKQSDDQKISLKDFIDAWRQEKKSCQQTK